MPLTYEDVKAELLRLADENPDYVYKGVTSDEGLRSCVYGDGEGNPSCIVGHVLYSLDREVFDKVVKSDQLNTLAITSVNLYGEIPVTSDKTKTMVLLRIAQDMQDAGWRWGRAVEYAIKRAERGIYAD